MKCLQNCMGIFFRTIEIFFKTIRHPVKIYRMILSLRNICAADGDDSALFLKELFESLGPIFVKFGQILSTRPDLLPCVFIENLKKLQDNAAVNGNADVQKILKSYFGEKYGDIFAEINTMPAHSASICLIYEGKLRSGESIVIKLKRPGIEKIIANDFRIFELITFFFQKKFSKFGFVFPESINRIKKQIFNELNLRKEIENAILFNKIFFKDANIKIPFVYEELCSNDFIIMEKISGLKIDSAEFKNCAGKNQFLNYGMRAFLKQIFINGIFHADPHPGNILFTEDNKIAFIDFGIVGRLSKNQQNSLFIISMAILNKNIKLLFTVLINERILKGDTDMNVFIEETELCLNKFIDAPLKKIHAQDLLFETLKLVKKFQMRIPPEFFELLRCLVILDGIGKQLSPDFSIINELKPALFEMMLIKYSLKEILNKIANAGLLFLYRIMKGL